MTSPTEANGPFPKLTIAQIFLENVQFSHKVDPVANIAEREFSAAEVQVAVEAGVSVEENKGIVRLRVGCDTEGAPYAFAASYVVLFSYDGDPPPDFQKRLSVTGATMAYPFVRELIANLSSRGRFGTTWISPVDFNAMNWAKLSEGTSPASE